jgi:hypothetical protein
MQPLAEHVVAERIRDLLREAEAARRAQAVAVSGRSRAAWRRWSGGAARRLSQALEAVAAELDPSVARPSYGRE